ncbi:MAG: hypothetical protein H6751_03145 [Candidatus Omnitrophica bacterium]|nr:hypothetical protein [Candidatus Omnitrophota bacterium]
MDHPSRLRRILVFVGVIGIVIIIFVIAAVTTFPTFLREKMRAEMGDENYAEFQEFYHGVFEIPEDWRQVEPFPPDLIRASSAFSEVRERPEFKQVSPDSLKPDDAFKQLLESSQFSRADRSDIQSDLERFASLLDALRTFVDHPDYEMEAFPDMEGTIAVKLIGLSALTKLNLLEACLAIEDGQAKLALRDFEIAIRFTRRHPAASLITHMLGGVVAGDVASTVMRVSKDWKDENTALDLLKLLNAMEESTPWESMDHPLFLERVSHLRNLIRHGYNWHIPKTMTGDQLMWQGSDWFTDSMSSRSHRTVLQRFLKSQVFDIEILRERMMAKNHNDFEGVSESSIETHTALDSARLALAIRILDIRGESIPAYSDEFSEEIFPEPVRSPRTGEAYKWDATEGKFLVDLEKPPSD